MFVQALHLLRFASVTFLQFLMQNRLHCQEKWWRSWIFSHSTAVKLTKVGQYEVVFGIFFSILCWLYDVWCMTFVQNVCRSLSAKFWLVWVSVASFVPLRIHCRMVFLKIWFSCHGFCAFSPHIFHLVGGRLWTYTHNLFYVRVV